MAAQALLPVDCSVQPLDFSFHPKVNIVAAGLVDGTVELHDFSTSFQKPHVNEETNVKMNEDDEEEDDTILSSIPIHCDERPQRRVYLSSPNSTNSTSTSKTKTKATPSTATGPSCTNVLFDSSSHNNDASKLFTSGNAGSLACLDTHRASHYSTSDTSTLWNIHNASANSVSSLYQIPSHGPTGPLLVSGDEDGIIRLWDVRICGGGGGGSTTSTSRSAADPSKAFDNLLQDSPPTPMGCVATFHQHSDYISAFTTNPAANTLLVTSADGCLSVFDLRRPPPTPSSSSSSSSEPSQPQPQHNQPPIAEFTRKSDPQDDELLTLCLMKNSTKVVCGTQAGTLSIWSYGTWGDVSDRFPGHPLSVDALLKVDETTILTGSSDGLIRALQIHPNKLLGVLGDHEGFPVESLGFTAERRAVGSLTHDTKIRLWDASILNDSQDDDDDEDEDDEDEDDPKDTKEQQHHSGIQNSTKPNVSAAAKAAVARRKCADSDDDDWDDMDDDDDSDDDEDSMDCDSDNDASGKKGRVFKTDNERFFEDL